VDGTTFNTGSITLNLYDATNISTTITAGGSPVTFNITGPGQNAGATFSGTSGQIISLNITSVTIPASSIFIYKPDGSTLYSNSLGTDGRFVDPLTLPASGTYTIAVDPTSTNTGNATLTLYDIVDGTGSLIIGGGAVGVTISVPGQKTNLTFTGTSSQQVTVQITGNTMGSVLVKLLKPDGTTLTSGQSGSSSFNLTIQTLPTTGTYTVVIDPVLANTGSLNVSVTSP
jgi:hypothetical protein